MAIDRHRFLGFNQLDTSDYKRRPRTLMEDSVKVASANDNSKSLVKGVRTPTPFVPTYDQPRDDLEPNPNYRGNNNNPWSRSHVPSIFNKIGIYRK